MTIIPEDFIDISSFSLIQKSYVFSNATAPERHVPIGVIAVAAPNQILVDRDNEPEFYLEGERIANRESKELYEKGTVYRVLLFNRMPGQVGFRTTRYLPGISASDEDVAQVQINFQLTLRNPRQLIYSAGIDWLDETKYAEMESRLREHSKREIKSLETASLHLWTHIDIHEVARNVQQQLDMAFAGWGIRLHPSNFTVIRTYPPELYRIALDFNRVSYQLMENKGLRLKLLLDPLGFGNMEVQQIRNLFPTHGSGYELFRLIIDRRLYEDETAIRWLEAQEAPHAARYLRRAYLGEYDLTDVRLSEQILFATFRYPLIGFGEWGDSTLQKEQFFAYRKIFLNT